MCAMGAVLQVLAVFEWYSVKSQQEGLKLDLVKVPLGQWGAFFLCVFLGQVRESCSQHSHLVNCAACSYTLAERVLSHSACWPCQGGCTS